MAKKKKSEWTKQLKVNRQEWSRSNSARKECLLNAKIKDANGLDKWVCNQCKNSFAESEISVDHIIPIQNTIPQTREEFFECLDKLFVSIDKLQVLCRKQCHRLKTKEECKNRKGSVLIKLVEGLLLKNGYSLNGYNLLLLDQKELRRIASYYCKIDTLNDENAIIKYQQKIFITVEKCHWGTNG